MQFCHYEHRPKEAPGLAELCMYNSVLGTMAVIWESMVQKAAERRQLLNWTYKKALAEDGGGNEMKSFQGLDSMSWDLKMEW